MRERRGHRNARNSPAERGPRPTATAKGRVRQKTPPTHRELINQRLQRRDIHALMTRHTERPRVRHTTEARSQQRGHGQATREKPNAPHRMTWLLFWSNTIGKTWARQKVNATVLTAGAVRRRSSQCVRKPVLSAPRRVLALEVCKELCESRVNAVSIADRRRKPTNCSAIFTQQHSSSFDRLYAMVNIKTLNGKQFPVTIALSQTVACV